jgi:Uma2 family endonuclease
MISLMINDPQLASELIADRQARQIDRYDEVWEDVYMMSPLANNEHQSLATELATAIATMIDWQGLGRTLAGANVSDRREEWTRNYRIPDVVVFQNETAAEDCGTHWFGGPELAIEIVSPGDRTLEKLDFYGEVGTRELLVVDRDPWQLTMYQANRDGKLIPIAISRFESPTRIDSSQFAVSFQLNPSTPTLDVLRDQEILVRAISVTRSNLDPRPCA